MMFALGRIAYFAERGEKRLLVRLCGDHYVTSRWIGDDLHVLRFWGQLEDDPPRTDLPDPASGAT
ncbi:hypothetical protein [Falsochrobactrum shanghaiense]|uniref:hypothetical protein n=1 Tax=Falsochrobactrum shanghaiense TaxID=2201899 RepID=UPI0011B1E24E|nr:hypothetical protein [Falsochrobactrum shanghaiense]